ncbi:MAG: hypothetical protein QG661_2078 [Actinomycetota bacterium]|nr:hypothetical protein [Actinomycetota bacterium]MDQ5974869.1 hypothetical protein [Actinomycetota bacterium]
MAKTLTKDRVLIGVSSMSGDWDTCSDPQSSRPVTKRRRAANTKREAVGGQLDFDDLTLTRFWDDARDAAIVSQWESNPDFYNGTVVSLTSLGTDGVAMGAAKTYTGIVQSCQRTGSDANSGDEGKLQIVVSVYDGA